MTGKPIVIAVCGARRAGKDTVAKILENRYGFINLKFARYLKDMIKAGFGFSDDDVEGCSKDAVHPAYDVTPRAIMQFIGTDVMQYSLQSIIPGLGRSFWARRLLIDINSNINDSHKKLVISDLRFMHEYEALRKGSHDHGYSLLIIKVTRPYTDKKNNIAIDTHISELEYEQILPDVLLSNEASIEAFQETVIRVLEDRFNID